MIKIYVSSCPDGYRDFEHSEIKKFLTDETEFHFTFNFFFIPFFV